MLQEIFIANEASYPATGQTIEGLKAVNFVFGTNGSGKTTISRVIADITGHTDCRVLWKDGREVQCLVYNSDFARDHFDSKMRGIFTLGQVNAETLTKIENAREAIRLLGFSITNLENTLDGEDRKSGKNGELQTLRSSFEEKCWKIKTQHDAYFSQAFEGYRNAKPKFCDKLLEELAANNSTVHTVDILKARATTVFEKGIDRIATLPLPDFSSLVELEASAILAKKVVGKEDINIAALIRKLGNSDWVKAGIGYLENDETPCPFCQQDVPTDLRRQLAEYFDEAYTGDIAEIDRVKLTYETYSTSIIERLEAIFGEGNRYLDGQLLRTEIDRLTDRVALNKRLLEQKRKEASSVIRLEPLEEITAALHKQILDANTAITSHNATFDNLGTAKATLISEIWKCLLEESSADFSDYQKAKAALDKAISGLSQGIKTKKDESTKAKLELSELEKSVTSVQPTVNEINAILTSFGFTGFSLKAAGENDSQYEIIRGDGSNAAKSLSEGERSFITFLYFYHRIRGSFTESGMNADRVIVFDDPVSSLDSDVLFIVSALIKRVLAEARQSNGQIKQVFVLTHNIYFHKEVSFDPSRSTTECRKDETFWIVRKTDDKSAIINFGYNPIKTSYELLWGEVKDPNKSKLTIQNTLRRILENYFKILGNMDKDAIVAQFEGRDQMVCSSLYSWVNDGSHTFQDDLYISSDDSMVDRYLRVFREIFEKTNHMGHFNMMMGGEPIQPPEVTDEIVGTQPVELAAG
jgi:wobble nucleotide-excising tRNase